MRIDFGFFVSLIIRFHVIVGAWGREKLPNFDDGYEFLYQTLYERISQDGELGMGLYSGYGVYEATGKLARPHVAFFNITKYTKLPRIYALLP